ncbi:MAG: aminotransferase class V-fold PLP-dependent enzyme [Candidatus Vogelbacteria bacterium]|nr:aminotransferase class V-fold PLP-dependent enzyme [Candidatus Vogelbacteria bacterium]
MISYYNVLHFSRRLPRKVFTVNKFCGTLAIKNMKSKIKHIYMDYAAATPMDERVISVMRKYLSDEFGNPSSVHSFGVRAKKAVEESRKKVADVLNCRPQRASRGSFTVSHSWGRRF